MPENVESETKGQKVRRQWCQMKIAERLLQAASLAANRILIRRGARKQQDGQLGQPGGGDDVAEEGDRMNISIGDNVNHYHPGPQQKPRLSGAAKLAGTAILASALGGTAGAGAMLLTKALTAPPPPAVESTDTDTTRRIDIEVVHRDPGIDAED